MMRWIGEAWRAASLRTKFLLVTVPLILASTIVFSSIFSLSAERSARMQLEDRMEKVAEIQAGSIAGPLWFINFRQLDLVLDAMANDPDYLGLVVFDENGTEVRRRGTMALPDGRSRTVSREIVHVDADRREAIGRLDLAYSLKRLDEETAARRWFAVVTAALLAVATITSALLALRFTVNRPLDRLLRAITRDREGKRDEPLEWHTSDEIGSVVAAYNDLRAGQQAYEAELRAVRDSLEQRVVERTRELLDRERDLVAARDRAELALDRLRSAQDRLVQAEKMASLGQLTAGIAHEIKNPLNFVNNFARISTDLLEEVDDTVRAVADRARMNGTEREDFDEVLAMLNSNLGKINEHGRRADSIVKNMLAHSRDEPSQIATTQPNMLVEEATGLVYHAARAERADFNITIEKDYADAMPPVAASVQDITRVLINIMSNGMYAAHQKHGSGDAGIEPTLSVRTSVERRHVRIDVSDNGGGIAQEDMERIFTPFFTTKPAGEGTGLGLSLSYDIVVTQHGGRLTAKSEKGRTTFTIRLPRDPALERAAAAEAPSLEAVDREVPA